MMNTTPTPATAPKNPRSRRRRYLWTAMLVALLIFLLGVHPFLAISEPVDANTMVVEGWVPAYVLDAAIAEFRRGHYTHIFVSGLEIEGLPETDDARATRYLVTSGGIAATRVIPVPAAATEFNRTSHMARAIRDRMHALGLQPAGVNVVTLGPHARQSKLAYGRLLGAATPVGVISIPKDDYNATFWWASAAGIKKTTKDFAAWVKEVLFGLRS